MSLQLGFVHQVQVQVQVNLAAQVQIQVQADLAAQIQVALAACQVQVRHSNRTKYKFRS